MFFQISSALRQRLGRLQPIEGFFLCVCAWLYIMCLWYIHLSVKAPEKDGRCLFQLLSALLPWARAFHGTLSSPFHPDWLASELSGSTCIHPVAGARSQIQLLTWVLGI